MEGFRLSLFLFMLYVAAAKSGSFAAALQAVVALYDIKMGKKLLDSF